MWFGDYTLIPLTKFKSRSKLTKFQNDMIFITVFMRLFNDALNRYKINGLPDTVSERVLLESLCIYGNVTFFDERDSLLALASVPSGKGYNIYGDPTSAWVFSKNALINREIDLYIDGGITAPVLNKGTSFQTTSPAARGVMVWETRARYPFINDCIYYARAIADTLRTLDVARKWLKKPFIPVCEESIVPSVKDMLGKIFDNEEVIPVSTGVMDIAKFDIKPIETSPNTIQSAMELVEWYENKFRELCGTNSNTQVDKKGENLISDEVHANDEYTGKKADGMLDCMQHYLDMVNSIYGTSITAERRETEYQNQNRG